MRGIPWLRFSVMAAVLAVFAIPVWLLTRADTPSPTPPPTPESAAAPREVTLKFATAPAAQAIGASYLGQELIPSGQASGSFSIQLPANAAADLLVTARWNGNGTAALRVQASDENGPLAEASFWGAHEVRDVFTVPPAPR